MTKISFAAVWFRRLAVLLAGATLVAGEPQEEPRAWLGVWLADAVDGGVEVVALVEDGPAERGGVEVGDVVVEAGGSEVATGDSLGAVLSTLRPGQRLDLHVLRGEGSQTLQIEVGARGAQLLPLPARPPAFSASAEVPVQSLLRPRSLGLEVADMTPALREHYGAPADEGVLVTRVGAGPAGAGLRIGDVVVQAGRQPIRSRPQLERVLWTWNWQQPVTLSVVRGDTDSVQIVLTASEQQAGDPARRIRIRTLERELGLLQERLAAIEAELSRLRAGR